MQGSGRACTTRASTLYLTAPELAYILNNSTSRFLITSRACREVALEAARDCPGLTSGLIVDGTGDDGIFADFEEATPRLPRHADRR